MRIQMNGHDSLHAPGRRSLGDLLLPPLILVVTLARFRHSLFSQFLRKSGHVGFAEEEHQAWGVCASAVLRQNRYLDRISPGLVSTSSRVIRLAATCSRDPRYIEARGFFSDLKVDRMCSLNPIRQSAGCCGGILLTIAVHC